MLHATDYSDCARYAYEVALDLATHHKARLLVLHVADTLGPENVSHGQATHERQPDGQRARLLRQLEEFAPPRPDLAVEHLLGEGNPGSVIAQTAHEHHCDLIVMGTYGRSALSRLLTGSVTQKVVQLTTCTILTVRMPVTSAAQPGH
jgi:nucleotide-binding universal stress UspA family protein